MNPEWELIIGRCLDSALLLFQSKVRFFWVSLEVPTFTTIFSVHLQSLEPTGQLSFAFVSKCEIFHMKINLHLDSL